MQKFPADYWFADIVTNGEGVVRLRCRECLHVSGVKHDGSIFRIIDGHLKVVIFCDECLRVLLIC